MKDKELTVASDTWKRLIKRMELSQAGLLPAQEERERATCVISGDP